ncbi:MAG: hypothetical protein C6H99_01395 [Epsilonproteobacteria bacterium]|nr:hypothetical protein [Campylobacterota bacterium]NPA63889.1 amidohydrolase family protein [Campylobacterota bacterium]
MVVKNARIVTFDKEYEGDILIKDGLIQAIGRGFDDEEVVDAAGRYVLPGLIDLGVRPLDDRINSTNLERLSNSAQRGGVTSIGLLPDTNPPINDEISLEFVKSHRSSIDILPLIHGLKDEGLSEISILLKKGALSVYVPSDINPYLLARIFEYAKMHQIVLFIEPKNSLFRDVGVMNDGRVSFELGLGGISKLEEHAEVAKIIQYSEYYNVPVLFCAVSTAKALDLIASSKLCYAQVSIHHLLFCDRACDGYNTWAKLSPPLRDDGERKELLEALVSGRIDLLTSLHSPKSMVSKDLSFDEAAFGVDAIASYLPLLYTHFVKSDLLSFPKVVELASSNAGCFAKKRAGKIEEGFVADLVLFDPNKSARLTINSLYQDTIVHGRVDAVMTKGEMRWVDF